MKGKVVPEHAEVEAGFLRAAKKTDELKDQRQSDPDHFKQQVQALFETAQNSEADPDEQMEAGVILQELGYDSMTRLALEKTLVNPTANRVSDEYMGDSSLFVPMDEAMRNRDDREAIARFERGGK